MTYLDVVSTCLNQFCRSSDEKLSLNKTRILFFLKKINWRVCTNISETFGFRRTDDLGQYVGVPLLHHRVVQDTL